MFKLTKRKPVTIHHYYQLSWLGMLPCAYMLAGASNLISVWLSTSALALSVLCLSSRPVFAWWTPRNRSWSVLSFALGTWIYAGITYATHHDIFFIIGEFLSGLIPLLLARRHRTFGHWMALLTASLLAMVGVVGGSGMVEYVLLILFLMFLVFNLNAANLLSLVGATGATQQSLPRGYLRQLTPSLTVGFIAGSLIFFLFPRTPRFWNPFSIRNRGGATTAYTGTVSLKASPAITESSELALLVESENVDYLIKRGPSMYFRGNTLDKFDGQDWSSPSRASWHYQPDVDLRFTLSSRLPARRMKVFREPHSTQAVLYPEVLLGISAPMSLLGHLSYDANANLLRSHREELRYSYEVLVSEPVLPRQLSLITLTELRNAVGREGRDAPLASGIIQGNLPNLLHIPDSVKNQEYFQRWIREVGIDPVNATLLTVFQTLGKHFQTKFRPTLSRKNASADTFRSFLEDEREGHCEYFATAAALHLRALNIPARIVLGYRGGTFNDVSRVLEVRELNAHAWIEAYFPLTGWITFDPTPFMTTRPESGFSLYASLYTNAAKFWFNRYVVNYNTQSQTDLLRSLASMKQDGPNVSVLVPLNMRTLESILVLTVLILFCIRTFTKKRAAAARRRLVPDYYEQFTRKLALQGWERKSGESYSAFHRRLARSAVKPDFLEQLDGALEIDLYTPRRTPESTFRELKHQISLWKIAKGSNGPRPPT